MGDFFLLITHTSCLVNFGVLIPKKKKTFFLMILKTEKEKKKTKIKRVAGYKVPRSVLMMKMRNAKSVLNTNVSTIHSQNKLRASELKWKKTIGMRSEKNLMT